MTEDRTALNPQTVAAICDQIGRKLIAAELDVRASAVSNAVADNCFPSKWYLVVKRLCAARRIECPDNLFAFSRPAPPATALSPDNEDAA